MPAFDEKSEVSRCCDLYVSGVPTAIGRLEKENEEATS